MWGLAKHLFQAGFKHVQAKLMDDSSAGQGSFFLEDPQGQQHAIWPGKFTRPRAARGGPPLDDDRPRAAKKKQRRTKAVKVIMPAAALLAQAPADDPALVLVLSDVESSSDEDVDEDIACTSSPTYYGVQPSP